MNKLVLNNIYAVSWEHIAKPRTLYFATRKIHIANPRRSFDSRWSPSGIVKNDNLISAQSVQINLIRTAKSQLKKDKKDKKGKGRIYLI